jgi:uncharacterized membrane protein (DUF2068 family)
VNQLKLHKAPHRWPLVLISLDKFVKGAGLLVISFFISAGWHQAVKNWVDAQTSPHNWLVAGALRSLEVALGFKPRSLPLIRIFVILYAGLYFIEGVGLLFERKWAEWMVVIGTAVFLPLEVYDFIRKPRWTIVIIFLLNLIMAIYLVWRLHRQAVIKRERAALGIPSDGPGFPVEPSKKP